MIGKKIFNKIGTGITLTNNEITDIMKIIRSLENRGILIKRTTRKISIEGVRFLNFPMSLMTAGIPLMKRVVTPLAKSLLILLRLSAGMSAADAANQNKIYGSNTIALIISNEEMEDIMEIVKSLEESGLPIKGISKTIENEAKKPLKKVDFFHCY